MRKLFILLLLLTPLGLHAQTTVNGRIMVGTLATRPASCSVADQFNTTDGNGAYLCNPTANTWQPIGGGGTFNQTIEQASIPLTQRPILNFPNYITCVDNPGNISTDCTPNIVVGAGVSHAPGIVPDPGPTLHNPPYVFTEAGIYQAPTAGAAATQNPMDTGHLSNGAFPFNLGGDIITPGPNPSVDARHYGARSVTNGSIPPAAPGITATMTSGSATASLSSASTFVNGDGVVVYGAGATNTMSTPGAPTVVPSLSASETGSLLDVAGPAGGAQYCYQIVARDKNGGLSAASTETCTATGATTLGSRTATTATMALSGNTVTVTTTAPHGLIAGAMINIGGVTSLTASYPYFGWFIVSSVGSSSFTYLVNSDSRAGTPIVGPAGLTVTYWQDNHITWTGVTGAYQYYIYGRVTGGTKTLIGVSWPQNSAVAGDTTYLAFDDFGSTVTTLPNKPSYVPTNPPGAATNDMLITTIASGAGTTTLTLASNAGNNAAGATILLDNSLALTTAAAAANANGVNVLIPSSLGGAFVFNAPMTIPIGTSVIQRGTVVFNETVTMTNTSWMGENDQGLRPQFAYTTGSRLFVNGNPGIYASETANLYNLNITNGNANGGTVMVMDANSAIPAGVLKDINFNLTSGTDYMNMAFVSRGTHVAAGAVWNFENITLTTSQNANLLACTPVMYFNNGANPKFTNLFFGGKGILLRPTVSGSYLEADTVYSQGNYEPLFSFTNALSGGGIAGIIADIKNVTLDTTFLPAVANLGGINMNVTLEATQSNSANLVTGVPNTVVFGPESTPFHQSKGVETVASKNSVSDGTFGIDLAFPLKILNSSMSLGTGYSIFSQSATPVAPTCGTPASGTGPTAGTWFYAITPVYTNGSEGVISSACNVTTSGGNLSVPLTWPAIDGVIGYDIYRGPAANSLLLLSASVPATTTNSYTDTSVGAVGTSSAPTSAAGGPAGLHNADVWASDFTLAKSAAPTGTVNQTKLYMDSAINWPNFKPNSNTAYSLLGAVAGAHSIGAVPCAADTTTGATTWCNTGAAGGIALSVQYNNGSGGLAGAPVPTGPLNVAQIAVSMPTSGGSQPIAFALPGVASRGASGVTDTILASDRAQQVVYSNGAPIAVSIPDPNTSDFNNWVMLTYVSGAGTPTFTPTGVALINGAATYAQTPSTQCKWTTPDNVNYLVTCPGAASLTTTGSPVAGNLTKFASSSQVTNGDLTGDATTSGTMTTTVGQLHFGATAFPLDTSAPTDQQLLFNNAGTISATGAIPSATLATTQSANDNTRKLATTAYVDSAIGGVNALGQNTVSNLFLSDNFCGGLSTEGTVGSLGWFTDFAGAATFQRDSNTSSDINHPCGISMNSGSTSGQYAAAYLQYCGSTTASASCSNAPSGTAGNIIAVNASGVFDSTWVIKLPAIASMGFAAGFQDWAAGTFLNPATAKNVIQVRFDTAVPDSSIVFVACDATPTCTTSTTNSISPVAGDWIKIRIRSAVAGTIRYSICQNAGTGGCSLGTETTINTNVPTTLMVPSIGIDTHTSAAKALVFNFFSIQQALTR